MVKAIEGPLQEITEQEVERAQKGMKNGRVAGPSGLTSDMLKYAECKFSLMFKFTRASVFLPYHAEFSVCTVRKRKYHSV